MSYLTIAVMATDRALQARVKAAVVMDINAQSAHATTYREWLQGSNLSRLMWYATARTDWSAAWESALASERPEGAPPIGEDAGVITDGMILATIQALAVEQPEVG